MTIFDVHYLEHLQPHHRYHATAGGGENRPRDRRYKRRNARTAASQGKSEPPPEHATEAVFEPYKPKIRKSGTGCVTMINDHLYEGRFTPRVNGKRISKNVYAKTREECEEKLAELIKTMKAEIAKMKKAANA